MRKRRTRYTQKSEKKEYPIPFHNDVFFKYMLTGEDTGSAVLRSRTIEEIYGLKVQRTQVLSPELLPEAFSGKRAVLDVILEDETGHPYDLEMQVSGCTEEEQLRFQQYGYRLVGRQLKQGNDYTKLKSFYQIIFMLAMPKDIGRMVQHYMVKDQDSQEGSSGTLYRAIVLLPMVRQRVGGVGGIENLTEFETFCYVFTHNPDDAILDMKRRMVNVAMEKYNGMREDDLLFSQAESTEFAERAVQANLREQATEAERLGFERRSQGGPEQSTEGSIVKGLEKGIEKGIEKRMERGLEKGERVLSKSQTVHKYGKGDDWIDTLPDHQVEDAILHILECDTYDALKDRLKDKEVKQMYTSN